MGPGALFSPVMINVCDDSITNELTAVTPTEPLIRPLTDVVRSTPVGPTRE